MAWHKTIPGPTSKGMSGRKRGPASVKVSDGGIITLSGAALDALGNAKRVRVEYDIGENSMLDVVAQLKLIPSSEDDTGAWAISGGGDTVAKIRMLSYASKLKVFAGEELALSTFTSADGKRCLLVSVVPF